jgi:hypothetical protein
MIILETKFKPTSDDPTVIGEDAAKAALARIKELEKIVEEVRDPQTGQAGKLSWESTQKGIEITIKGSDFVISEVERRIAALQ